MNPYSSAIDYASGIQQGQIGSTTPTYSDAQALADAGLVAQKGTYWKGSDGNVWVAGDSGTNSAGAWNDGTIDYWNNLGYQQIADPSRTIDGPVNYDYTGTGGTGSTTQNQLLQQGMNTGIANLEGQLRVLDPQEQGAKLRVTDQFNTNQGRLTQDYNTGVGNLQRATDNVNESKTRSLANLGDWLRGMGQGYQNQLGTMGAGNSSATGLINFALGKQGGRERGNILQDATGQLENIDLQGQQLEVDFQRANQDLNKWKESSLFDITTQYQQARNQINNSILDARARAAAEMELTQQAVDYLSQLEQNYRTQAEGLASRYAQVTQPGTAINQSLMNFQTTPVQQASLNGIGMPTAVNPESGVEAFLRRRDESAFSNPLGA